MVIDLGFVETAVDKIVDSVDLGGPEARENTEQLAQSAFAQDGRMFGPRTRATVWGTVPFELGVMAPLYLSEIAGLSIRLESKLLLFRLLRIRTLLQFFREVCV
jgi:hypothetical protein